MTMRAAASAPASIGNVGVGFDVLGLSFDAARDVVTATREDAPGVRLGDVSGLVTSLPAEPARNTALAAAASLLEAVGAPFGVRLDIRKGIPISAGMGGSASSAVAASAAVNALLDRPLQSEKLLPFALDGERVSSDPPPWDNVMAALRGGLVIAAREHLDHVHALPVPDGIVSVLFHPDARIETSAARKLLRADVPMRTAVEHARRIAAFVAGCATSDVALLRDGLQDLLVEPQRAPLLPVFPSVQRAALQAGAIGCSFSGSGPSMFAWAETALADTVAAAMASAFADGGIRAREYRAPVASPGVRLEPVMETV